MLYPIKDHSQFVFWHDQTFPKYIFIRKKLFTQTHSFLVQMDSYSKSCTIAALSSMPSMPSLKDEFGEISSNMNTMLIQAFAEQHRREFPPADTASSKAPLKMTIKRTEGGYIVSTPRTVVATSAPAKSTQYPKNDDTSIPLLMQDKISCNSEEHANAGHNPFGEISSTMNSMLMQAFAEHHRFEDPAADAESSIINRAAGGFIISSGLQPVTSLSPPHSPASSSNPSHDTISSSHSTIVNRLPTTAMMSPTISPTTTTNSKLPTIRPRSGVVRQRAQVVARRPTPLHGSRLKQQHNQPIFNPREVVVNRSIDANVPWAAQSVMGRAGINKQEQSLRVAELVKKLKANMEQKKQQRHCKKW